MISLTDENFEKEILDSQKPILVDFYSSFCPPCTILSPILEKIEKDFKEKIIFGNVNVDLAPLTAQKSGRNQIPTIILFKNGKILAGFIGARPESEIKLFLEENLKKYESR